VVGTQPTIDEIELADDPAGWEALGFELAGDAVRLGDVRLKLAGRAAGKGIMGWTLRDLPVQPSPPDLDGLPTCASEGSPAEPSSAHPNGIGGIDHVVAMTPQLDRSVERLKAGGLDLRRIREQPTPAGAPRQAFFRLGAVILEVVQEPAEALERRGRDAAGPARFWGLALLAEDLEQTVSRLGEHSSVARAAVQPGRRIATLRRSAGLAVPVAIMSPPA
jgi:hypothetical protein